MPDQTYWAETLVRSREDLAQMLLAARESLGVSPAQVAEVLRIRETYLRAIEEGRFDDLPGPTYATAFLRSYAGYVGFNGDDVVAAWRQLDPNGEEARLSHKFRILESEKRLPRGTMVLLSLLLLAGAYGVWSWMGREDVAPVPPVAEVPADLKPPAAPTATAAPVQPGPPPGAEKAATALPQLPPAVAPAPATDAATAPPANDPPAAPRAGATAAAPVTQPATPATPQPARDKPASPAAAPQAAPAATAAGATPRPSAPTAASQSQPAPSSVPPAAAATALPQSVTPVAPPAAAAVPPSVEARPLPPAAAATLEAGTKPTDRPAAPARVEPAQPRERTIRATVPTLLELRDASTGEVLATVNLRAGQSYTVPSYIAYRLVPES